MIKRATLRIIAIATMLEALSTIIVVTSEISVVWSYMIFFTQKGEGGSNPPSLTPNFSGLTEPAHCKRN